MYIFFFKHKIVLKMLLVACKIYLLPFRRQNIFLINVFVKIIREYFFEYFLSTIS